MAKYLEKAKPGLQEDIGIKPKDFGVRSKLKSKLEHNKVSKTKNDALAEPGKPEEMKEKEPPAKVRRLRRAKKPERLFSSTIALYGE